MIILHAQKRVELWRRMTGSPDTWTRTDYEPGGKADVDCIGCTLDADSIYRAAEEPAG